MTRLALAVVLPLVWAAPAVAQQMDSSMPGMVMPGASQPGAKTATTLTEAKPKTTQAPAHKTGKTGQAPVSGASANGSMPGMNMAPPSGALAGTNRSGQTTPAPGAASEPPIPNTPPPPPAKDHLADRYYDPAAMAAARRMLQTDMGGSRFSKIMLNLAEYQAGGGGYRWDGEAWFGGDINRLVLRSEGEGGVKDGLETGEGQALYSRAVGPYLDLLGGVRQDFSPHARTYLAIGAQALLPYWFDVEGEAFLSTHGELLARAEGYYDLRLLQRVVLQPRVELNLAAQNSPVTRTGAGLSNAEVGLRLRYEVRREFAPYIGVSWDRFVGKTADYWRAAGHGPGGATFVVGLSTFF